MKTTDLLLIGGLAVGVYFLMRKTDSSPNTFISTYGGNQNLPPTTNQPPTNNPVVVSEAPSTTRSRQNANETAGLVISSRNNAYDRTTGTIQIGGQGFSVAPQNVGKLITQQTIGQSQRVYSRVNINPYGGF